MLGFRHARHLKMATVCAAFLAAASGYTESRAQSPSSSTTVRAIGTLPINSYGTTGLDDFKKSVEKSSNGSLKVETYPAGQLYSDKDAPNVIPNGSVDVGIVNTDFWTGKDPLVGILMIPMLYDSYEHFYSAREKMFDQLDKSLQKKANVKLIGWLNYSTQTIGSKSKIATIDDFPRKRMRGWGQYSSSFFKYAGSDTIVMGAGDVYDALAKGTIDGEMSAWVSQLDRKFYEVASYMTDMSLLPATSYAVVVNMNTWKKLSADQQKVMQSAATDLDKWSREKNKEDTDKSIALLKKRNVKITTITGSAYEKIRDKTLPQLKKEYLSETGEEGTALWETVERARPK